MSGWTVQKNHSEDTTDWHRYTDAAGSWVEFCALDTSREGLCLVVEMAGEICFLPISEINPLIKRLWDIKNEVRGEAK